MVVVCAVVIRRLGTDSIKAVDVELALEGTVFCLVEVLRHDRPRKFLGFVDFEAFTGGEPGNNVLLLGFVGVF